MIVAIAVVVAVVVLAVVVGDRIALQAAASDISSRIEHRLPGSHAAVTISSSPFVIQLALSGTVEEVRAHVTGVTDGGISLDSVDVTAYHLKISRSSLWHGSIRLLGLSYATITAAVSVAEVARVTRYGSLAGLEGLASGVTGSVEAGSGRVQITFGPFTFSVPYGSLVPCVGSAQLRGDEIILSCTTTTLPPALQAAIRVHASEAAKTTAHPPTRAPITPVLGRVHTTLIPAAPAGGLSVSGG